MPEPAFTLPGIRVHLPRNRCSRSPESVFTMLWNGCSPSAGICVHDAPEYAFQLLNTEAQALTKIGNDYQIRHSEKRTQAVDDPYQIDYFFERLYALIRLLLRKSGRHR